MQRGCAVCGGRMSEPEEVVFMEVELTVTLVPFEPLVPFVPLYDTLYASVFLPSEYSTTVLVHKN